jgi:hypothetical protein
MTRFLVSACMPFALLLTACEPADTVKVETVDAAGETAVAGAGGATARRLPLPDCDDPAVRDAGVHFDCRGMLPGDSGVAYEARYLTTDDGMMRLAVQIVGPGDATLQTFDEPTEGAAASLSVQDIDADGRADLLLPLVTGNVNTNWAIWRGAADGSFTRAGELSGVEIARTQDGYIASLSRSGAATWEVGIFTLSDDKLTPIATAEVEVELLDVGAQTRETCRIRDEGGLADIKMSPIQAEKKFCADPLVSGIFN